MAVFHKLQSRLGYALRAGRRRTSTSVRRHAYVGPADQWDMIRDFQFRFLTSHGLRPDSRLLDIGCGTLRGGLPLIEYLKDGHYTGVEARPLVLEEARRELADAKLEHKRPRLICAEDPSQVQLDEPVDVVWAFEVLVHMRDEIVDACFGLVSRALAQDGVFYANIAFSDEREEQARWQGFPVISRPRTFYEQLCAAHGLSMEDVGRLDALGHGGGSGSTAMMLRFERSPAG